MIDLGMNDDIRTAVRVALAQRDQKQNQLAERVGVSKQYLNSVLQGKAGKMPDVWAKIFDELELELYVKPKDSSKHS